MWILSLIVTGSIILIAINLIRDFAAKRRLEVQDASPESAPIATGKLLPDNPLNAPVPQLDRPGTEPPEWKR
jgi:hypothetical protein